MCVYSRIALHTLSLKQKTFFPGYPYKCATFFFFRHVPLPLFISRDLESVITGIRRPCYFVWFEFSLFCVEFISLKSDTCIWRETRERW
ncbi:hypothetical protein L1887_10273 [Cichorium endivia]|nr:hypothetical protein L1887_10273 [Cichorium endivia]